MRATAFWFLLALATRLAFLYGIGKAEWPHSLLYEGDATTWVRWARLLAAGEPFDFDLPIWPPGAAYLLYWLGAGVPGASLVPAKLVWCAVSAASVAALFAVLRRTLSERTAWIAAGIACFSFGSYVAGTSLNSEAWYALAVVVAIGGTQRLARAPSFGLAAGMGAMHGATLLFRPEHQLLLGALALWIAFARGGDCSRSRRVAVAVVTVAVAFATCLPWSVRGARAAERFNTVSASTPDYERAQPPWTSEARAYLEALPAFARDDNFRFLNTLARADGKDVVDEADVRAFFDERFGYTPRPLGRWTLVSMNGPLDFALANHPDAGGGFTRGGLRDAFGEGDVFAFSRPSHLALFQRGVPMGLDWIAADPSAWLGLVGRKLEIFAEGALLGWTGWDLPYGRGGLRRPVDLVVPTGRASSWVRLALGVWIAVGCALAFGRPAARPWLLVVGYKLAVTVFFYGYARQAVSIQPAFAVLAALPLAAVAKRWEERKPRLSPRTLGLALLTLLAAADLGHALAGVQWSVRFVDPSGGPLPADEFGRGVLVTNDAIEIEPRRGQ